MLLPLKAVISKKIKKDGTSTIYYQYCFSSTNRVLLSTEIAIPAIYWNKKRQCVSALLPKDFGLPETLNKELIRQKKIIEALIINGEEEETSNIGCYVKERFSPSLQSVDSSDTRPAVKRGVDFFKEIDSFISSKERTICKESVACLRGMKEHLLAFQNHTGRKITFQSLDYNFYMDFVEFLTHSYVLRRKKKGEYGLKTSTIGRTIKKLRMFIKDRVRRKIIQPIDMSEFKILDEETDAIYLAYEEISKIYYADLSAQPHLIQYRDLFVLGCLTGLRFSDYTTLRYED
ncbi:MAG: phage integrase SAM-like domain-containing protein, partial [Taibaiella sp.]|nr:phage integrase SAM-like domain-containing protein [Taibaiella sp.]